MKKLQIIEIVIELHEYITEIPSDWLVKIGQLGLSLKNEPKGFVLRKESLFDFVPSEDLFNRSFPYIRRITARTNMVTMQRTPMFSCGDLEDWYFEAGKEPLNEPGALLLYYETADNRSTPSLPNPQEYIGFVNTVQELLEKRFSHLPGNQ